MRYTTSAVVVTYNRKDSVCDCLDGILRQTEPVDKIILVDNASNDGTPEKLDKGGYLANPAIDYVRLPHNTGGAGGFSQALNVLMRPTMIGYG